MGVGDDQTDFTWTAYNDAANGLIATPGQVNVNQTMVPAPAAFALLGLAGLTGARRRRA
jgi:hypothetical protein